MCIISHVYFPLVKTTEAKVFQNLLYKVEDPTRKKKHVLFIRGLVGLIAAVVTKANFKELLARDQLR